jgi:DMSO/TMAO reductase YedYZ molybdopterin-dependent catalytic subunit
MIPRILFFVLISALSSTAAAAADDLPVLVIEGAVKQPLALTPDDLAKFQALSVRLCEVHEDMSYHGVYWYSGPSLKTLLELALIEKDSSDFMKPVDLAIVVRNGKGERAVLSWGEVFYRNPSEVVVAVEAAPVMPHSSCGKCHTPEVYEPRYAELRREVGFPKLVVTGDFYNDRSLEGVTRIEVVDLRPPIPRAKKEPLYSAGCEITGEVTRTLSLHDLSAFARSEAIVKLVGDGKGYHGIRKFSGVSLAALLGEAGMKCGMNAVVLVSAPDGYRSLFSMAEIFLSPPGRNILIADMCEGEPLEEDGRFCLVVPNDLAVDRWVKAVEKIQVIPMP